MNARFHKWYTLVPEGVIAGGQQTDLSCSALVLQAVLSVCAQVRRKPDEHVPKDCVVIQRSDAASQLQSEQWEKAYMHPV